MTHRLLLLWLLCWSVPVLAGPKVVVSVAPIHSLVSGVMEGVGEPQLLIPAGASPHDFALKPSDARALNEAELIVWVGAGLEGVLARPIRALGGDASVMELAAVEGMTVLPSREGVDWHKEEDEAQDTHSPDHEHGAIDTHLWLSPDNAVQIIHAVAEMLSKLDSVNAKQYQANATALDERVKRMSGSLQQKLAPVQDKPYIVFHDAYHYFEQAFGLSPAGAIAVSPERRPGARRIMNIRKTIEKRGAVCVFSEPQFRPAMVKVVMEGSPARHGVLDPLGVGLAPGKEQWFQLMQNLADNLHNCLSDDS